MPDLNDKLKLLKVVDLKALLTKANIPIPPRANKADLISKIAASKPAIDVYTSLYSPPEESVIPPVHPTDSSPHSTPPPTITSLPVEPISTNVSADDTEDEKRKKRAARFAIAVVEPPASAPVAVCCRGSSHTLAQLFADHR